MKGKIAYKVVSKGNYSLCKYYYPKHHRRRYLLNKTTTARSDSIGLFIYKTESIAIAVAKEWSRILKTRTKVLRVEIIGDIYIPNRIGCFTKLEEFYSEYSKKDHWYRSVNVRIWVENFCDTEKSYLADAIKPIEVVKVFRNGKEVIR